MADSIPDPPGADTDEGILLGELPQQVAFERPAGPSLVEASAEEEQSARRRLIHAPTATLWTSFILVLGSAALPWIASPSIRALPSDIPIRFVYDVDATSGGASLIWVVIALSVAILLGSISPFTEWLRRAAGAVALAFPVLIMMQWLRFLNDSALSDRFWGFIGVGCFAIGAGGLLAMLAQPRNRR